MGEDWFGRVGGGWLDRASGTIGKDGRGWFGKVEGDRFGRAGKEIAR